MPCYDPPIRLSDTELLCNISRCMFGHLQIEPVALSDILPSLRVWWDEHREWHYKNKESFS